MRQATRLTGEEDRLRQALAATEERLRATLSDLEEARHEIEVQGAARERSLAVLIHELRMPLTPALLMARLLEDDASLSPQHRETAATIRRNVELESRLVNDLFDLTRIAYDKLELTLAEVDLAGKLREVLADFDRQVRDNGLAVVLRLQADDHRVAADPVRLRQILWNLIHNALKFTPRDGRITIRSASAGPRRLALEVADTGIGIAPDLLQRIFLPFEQGARDVTRKFGGLGLGLAVCKSLVEAHGGTLSARSEGPGKGAAFLLELPLAGVP
jgi:signal transduction histidine kinase